LLQTPLPILPARIWLDIPGVLCADAQRIAREVQAELEQTSKSSIVQPRIRLVHDENDSGPKCGQKIQRIQDEEPDLEIRLTGDAQQYSFDLQAGTARVISAFSPSQRAALPKDLTFSISDVFADEQIAHLLRVHSLTQNHPYGETLMRFDGQAVRDIEKQIGRAAKVSPKYHLTFSLFAATGAPSSWDVQQSLEKHISPLVHALRDSIGVEVNTQVQLFSPYSPSITSFQLEGTRGNFLRESDLTSFVNAAEWPLSPSIGEGPTLNFIVYVPSKADLPLGIDGNLGGAWVVPQWGGISIVNPDMVEDPETGSYVLPTHLSEKTVAEAFSTFSSQLLALLGVPFAQYRGTTLPLPLRLRSHVRLTALSLHLKAASNLGSLARLAKHLSSIPIPKHVAQLVDDSMSNLTASATALNQGQWADAVQHASTAYEDSEKAFFDKSMVGQVYFPDEHKVAVYTPLLGPIALPLVMALVREVKRLLTMLRTRKA
jgi:GPI-anchor transamidase subunit S